MLKKWLLVLLLTLLATPAMAVEATDPAPASSPLAADPFAAAAPMAADQAALPKVRLETTFGDITIELLAQDAPVTVANFLNYVRQGFYDNTIFHRVIPGFVVQGGGFAPGLEEKKPELPPIKNEAGNGLANRRATVAMARTIMVDSATSQFFINLADNPYLDHLGTTPKRFGYAVFGRVSEGMEVVNEIALRPTGNRSGQRDVPLEDVIIKKAVEIK